MIVTVFSGSQKLETRSCRTTILNDGRQAAIWDGLAFPLLEGERIDVDGEGFSPIESLFTALAPLSWTSIEIADAVHVLLQGSGTTCEEVASALKREGLPVLRWGRYFGDPVGGMVPDWFIRISRTSDAVDPKPIVARLIGTIEPGDTQGKAPLRERLLASELEAARLRNASQRQEVESLRGQLERHHQTQQDLPLLRRLADEERALRVAAEHQLTQLFAWHEEQARDNSSEPMREAEPNSLPLKVASEIEDFLATMFPRIVLLRDSFEVIVSEFSHRRGVYRALDELQRTEQRVPSNWKLLKGLREWWERHLSTGYDDSGRIYARLDRSDRRWQILIGHKVEQERDLAWLARN